MIEVLNYCFAILILRKVFLFVVAGMCAELYYMYILLFLLTILGVELLFIRLVACESVNLDALL